MPIGNAKISQLPVNVSPTLGDIFPTVTSTLIDKQLSLSGLTNFLNNNLDFLVITGGTYVNGSVIFTDDAGGQFAVNGFYTGTTDVFVTGGTYDATTGIATFINVTGGTFDVSGFTKGDIYVTGGTFNDGIGTATFTNTSGGTFDVTGFTSNIKHWVNNSTRTLGSDETLLISGNYVLNNSTLYLNSANNQISVGDIKFNEYAQIFIGGYLLLINSTIVNNGEISVGGAIILSGSSTITGSGIII